VIGAGRLSPFPRRAAHAAVLVALALLAACGKKGPPLAPLRVSPARIEDLSMERTGDTVRARFTVPAVNDDKSTPADIVAVELHAISGEPQDPLGQPLGGAEFVRLADAAGRVEIKPILTDAPPQAEALAKLDPRPAQGEPGVITEKLTAAARTPFVHPRKREATKADEPPTEVRPLLGPPPELPFSRVYVVTGVSRKGVRSGVSNRVAVPLDDTRLTPPQTVGVGYTATQLVVSWVFPPDAAIPIQRGPAATEIPARALVSQRVPTTYNVFTVTRKDGAAVEATQPINPSPVGADGFALPLTAFGEERCFVVRAGLQYGKARVDGTSSAVACATPIDKFPPGAPKGLVAVGSEGGVSLIWDANTEGDLAGYLVLRGEVGPGGAAATLAPLMETPLKETTFRDTTARPGVRYVYAVVAVDTASPRNVSEESNRVEEGAR
jgi:hypothetical protein